MVESKIDELYQLPPDQFVSSRNALAKTPRADVPAATDAHRRAVGEAVAAATEKVSTLKSQR